MSATYMLDTLKIVLNASGAVEVCFNDLDLVSIGKSLISEILNMPVHTSSGVKIGCVSMIKKQRPNEEIKLPVKRGEPL